ncbi:Bgt-1648 [Blumeria graminis f. sp. tritici]|uniref:Bgt-1648 n=2 Tax=Blumeria graminis f. sp. tritici TaxID=62690 RepID=A0A9X9L885_BLUGR|nr:Uridine-cytidine kinase [Blumeria graminis f. sp. tritici 96224]VCU39223.1 Bgt-1648 [Blumeria graminis f. sp. tritici]
MVTQFIEKKLLEKSNLHRAKLKILGQSASDHSLSDKVLILEDTRQLQAMNTILQDDLTSAEEFIFYFDRVSTLLVENGLEPVGETSAVVVLRAGSSFETGLKRVSPDCRTGRILIQSNDRNGEPELHYLKLPDDIHTHDTVLILDPQLSSGGAALMAVQVLIDHGVAQDRIVFVTYFSGRMGLNRLTHVFPHLHVVVCKITGDIQERWIEKKYFGC